MRIKKGCALLSGAFMYISIIKKLSVIMFCNILFACNVYADIVISGTRVIYPSSASEVMVHLENKGRNPLLVQSWIDTGDENVNPQEIKTPFLITPAITRINESQGQTIKITYLEGNLPKDRESIFWFNTLEVPPKADDEKIANHLQLAFRTRIKLFYRPDGLKSNPEDAIKNLKWSLSKKGNGITLLVKNNSPYFISLNSLSIVSNGKIYPVDFGMIAPMTSVSYMIKNMKQLPTGDSNIEYSAINDFGGSSKIESSI